MPRTAAALIMRSREDADREANARRANAAAMLPHLSARDGIAPIRTSPHADPGFLRLPLRIPRGLAAFASAPHAKRAGIAASYPLPLPRLPQVQDLLAPSQARYPGAEQLVRELVTLPTHSRMGREERTHVLRLLNTCVA